MAKISGYLTVFDDWDALPETLASVAPILDEIVVVDGAYDWMAPYLKRFDPTRSKDAVYDSLAPYAGKTRVIAATWADEIQKRIAGFEACSGRHVLRFDADEIFHFDHAALERFLTSPDHAVGEVEIPAMITPDFIRRGDGPIERVGVLFDSQRVTARDHLDYLWLILPPELGQKQADPRLRHPEPLAFTAHLTGWRTPEPAIRRALFYTLLSVRRGRQDPAWLRGLDPADISYAQLSDVLSWTAIVRGAANLSGFQVAPSPLNPQQRDAIRPIHQRYLQGLATLNHRSDVLAPNGANLCLDLTTPKARDALASGLRFAPETTCTARVQTLRPTAPFTEEVEVAVRTDGPLLTPELPPHPDDALARTLKIFAQAPAGRFLTVSPA